MHDIPRRLLLGVILTGAVACGRSDSRTHGEAGGEAALAPDEALVRVVNAIPGEGPIDVFAGDARTFSGVTFRGVTDFARVSPNTPTFRIAAAGQPAADTIAEEMAMTRDGHAYTLVAMGGAADGRGEIAVLRDDTDDADTTKARLRVVNAAAGSGELDVFLADDDEAPFFDDLDVRDDDGFRDVDPGITTIVVRPDDQRTVLLSIPNIALRAGHRLTLVLTRTAPGSERLSAIRLDDVDRDETTAARDRDR